MRSKHIIKRPEAVRIMMSRISQTLKIPASGVIRNESEQLIIKQTGAASIADIPPPSSFRLLKRFIIKNTLQR
ncbi:MAG: hypothetical protein ACI4T6_10535 [Candidatus Flemingiibacterium sp.]